MTTLGPVQMLVIGFENADFRGEIADELDRLRANDMIHVIDVIVVMKDEGARVRIVEAHDGEGGIARRLLDAEEADLSYLDGADAADLWDVADSIPPGTAAAIALLEHTWAIPLRDAIVRAGGRPLADAWLAPEDMASIGIANS